MPSENEPHPGPRLSVAGTVMRVRMAGPGPRRVWFVRIACTVAVALFVTTSAMIYVGWHEEIEPAGMIVVNGHAGVADAKVTISGPALPEPLTRTFAEGTQYRLRFHLPPGTYRLQVLVGTSVLYSNDALTVDRGPLEVDPFGDDPPTTPPAASPTATRPA